MYGSGHMPTIFINNTMSTGLFPVAFDLFQAAFVTRSMDSLSDGRRGSVDFGLSSLAKIAAISVWGTHPRSAEGAGSAMGSNE